MRWMLMSFALALAFAPQAYQAPPGHGPYSGRAGWHCYKGNTEEKFKLVQCACKQICDEDGDGNMTSREDGACLTYCGSKQCLCHVDSDECQHE